MEVIFLYWNTYQRPLLNHLLRLVALHSIDILILTEWTGDSAAFAAQLQQLQIGAYQLTVSASDKTVIFSRLSHGSVIDTFNDQNGSLTIRRLRLGGPKDYLLAAVHLPSRVNYDHSDQIFYSTIIGRTILETENQFGITDSIIVGDFNMDPFDPGIIGSAGFHATMTKRIAQKQERTINGQSYRFFYNPMWGLYGDRTTGPAGTYFLQSSKPSHQFWHMYDQVLLRPGLMHKLNHLQIVDTDGQEMLVTNSGIPKKSTVSDHLPILFRITL